MIKKIKAPGLLIFYLIFFIVFLAVPAVWTFILSLQKGGLLTGLSFIGFKNYLTIWKDKIFIETIINTFYYVILIVPSVMVFSLVLAVIISKMRKFQNFVKICIFLPLLSSVTPLSLMWKVFLVPQGAINYLLGILFGIPPLNWLGNPKLVIFSIAIFEFWRGFGFWTIIFLAGIASIPEEIYEASSIDGASSFLQFFKITIPLLRPTFVFLAVMGFIWNFQIFDAIFMLTNGGPGYASHTMVWYVYKNAFLYEGVGKAATMGVILMAIITILSLLAKRTVGREI